jgi:hypothetical protein
MAKKAKKSKKEQARELQSQAARLLWQDPTWSKKVRKAMIAARSTDEARAAASEARKREWADPVIRARRMKGKLAAIKRKRRER